MGRQVQEETATAAHLHQNGLDSERDGASAAGSYRHAEPCPGRARHSALDDLDRGVAADRGALISSPDNIGDFVRSGCGAQFQLGSADNSVLW